MSVQSVLFVHRPSNCYPLIGNCCYVRPVLPTGHPAVFSLDKGKGTRKLSASQRGAARAAGECVPHAAALARLPVKTQEAARREPEQSGASAESAVTTHRGPGAQPRHAFGSFRRETKGTPGVGRVGPLVGAGAASPARALRGGREKKGGS